MTSPFARQDIGDTIGVDDSVMQNCLSWFNDTRGVFLHQPDRLESVLSHLQIHAVRETEVQYMYCGAQSVVGDLYGREFCYKASGKFGLPDSSFERSLNWDYTQVLRTETPIMQRVNAPIDVYGQKYYVDFYRFVFPIYVQGVNAVAVLARFADSPARLN